jgi:hypothetical protein
MIWFGEQCHEQAQWKKSDTEDFNFDCGHQNQADRDDGKDGPR